MISKIFLSSFAILLLFATAGCVSEDKVKTSDQAFGVPVSNTVTNSEGPVTIEVSLLNAVSDDYKDSFAFEVGMNTHSVALDYDLTKFAVLKDSKGNVFKPLSWTGGRGGHHVSGVLQFPKGAAAGTLELLIKDVGNVSERSFKFDYP